MNPGKKFLFETRFDGEDGDASAADARGEPEKPSYGEEELAQARDEGFAAGREQGLKDAAATIEHAAARALEAVAAQAQELYPALLRDCERRNAEALQAAMVVVRKLFPILNETQAAAELEGLVCRCLEQLHDEPRVVIRVSDALLDPLRGRLEELAARSGFEGKIVLLTEESLLPGDVRVEWADGGAERDSQRLWREVDEIVARAAGLGARPPSETPAGDPAATSATSHANGTAANGAATTPAAPAAGAAGATGAAPDEFATADASRVGDVPTTDEHRPQQDLTAQAQPA